MMKKIIYSIAIIGLSIYPAQVDAQTEPASRPVQREVKIVDNPLSGANLKYSSLLAQAQFSYDQKDYKQSLALFREAFRIKREPFVGVNIATLYMMLGDGYNCLRIIKELDIKDPMVIGRLMTGLVERGQLTHAKILAESSAALDDNGDIAYASGVLYERLRDYANAEQSYKRAAELNANEPLYIYAYARINDILQRYEKAFELYKDVVDQTNKGELYIYSSSRMEELQQMNRVKPQTEP